MRQPDIEIYVKECDMTAIAEWLSQAIGPCTPWQKRGQMQRCQAGGINVTWTNKAVGSWHSLWLDSDQTPWATDTECAQAAFAALGVEIRCAPSGWDEEEDMEQADRWLKVTSEGVEEIVWQTA